MLKTLSIWNFALIEHVQIDFDKGLNILTGETGAGKSILLGALGMVIGRRTNIDAIRSGCEFMRVEAVFTLDNNLVKDFLTKYNILVEDDDLIITRQININGKNSVQINNCHTTMAILRQLGELLVDIHGQHANQALLKPIKQLSLIDMYDGDAIQKQKEAYLEKYYQWLQIKQKLGISGVQSDICAWKGEGGQIDLLIDRRDQTINLCEMKFSQSEFEITKQYDKHLRERAETFRSATKTRKALHQTFITTYGVKKNMYSGTIQGEVKLDDLFIE